MISNKTQKTTSSSKFSALDSEEVLSTIFSDTIPAESSGADSRRRLEDRIESRRLRREMSEFDFELDS